MSELPTTLDRDLADVLDWVGPVWSDLQGARLFITGGTGFFGCWLLESLCHANRHLGLGARATVLTRTPGAFRRKAPHLAGNPAVELVEGDVLALPDLPGEYSHVIHAAGDASTLQFQVDPLRSFNTLVLGTQNVLAWASGKAVDRFLFTSSGAVYGPQPPELKRIPDHWPGAPDCTSPRAAYGEGKRAAETLCALHASQSGMAINMARCFAQAGPYLPMDAQYALGNFIRDALAGGPIVIAGDGTPLRSYLYASDLTAWLWQLLLRGPSGLAINVGSEEEVSVAEVANLVSRMAGGVGIQVRRTPDPTRPPERYVPATARAQAMGLQMHVDLEEAIHRTIAWNRLRSTSL
jgi:dTDP-glucose 4,6-dehydratase